MLSADKTVNVYSKLFRFEKKKTGVPFCIVMFRIFRINIKKLPSCYMTDKSCFSLEDLDLFQGNLEVTNIVANVDNIQSMPCKHYLADNFMVCLFVCVHRDFKCLLPIYCFLQMYSSYHFLHNIFRRIFCLNKFCLSSNVYSWVLTILL